MMPGSTHTFNIEVPPHPSGRTQILKFTMSIGVILFFLGLFLPCSIAIPIPMTYSAKNTALIAGLAQPTNMTEYSAQMEIKRKLDEYEQLKNSMAVPIPIQPDQVHDDPRLNNYSDDELEDISDVEEQPELGNGHKNSSSINSLEVPEFGKIYQQQHSNSNNNISFVEIEKQFHHQQQRSMNIKRVVGSIMEEEYFPGADTLVTIQPEVEVNEKMKKRKKYLENLEKIREKERDAGHRMANNLVKGAAAENKNKKTIPPEGLRLDAPPPKYRKFGRHSSISPLRTPREEWLQSSSAIGETQPEGHHKKKPRNEKKKAKAKNEGKKKEEEGNPGVLLSQNKNAEVNGSEFRSSRFQDLGLLSMKPLVKSAVTQTDWISSPHWSTGLPRPLTPITACMVEAIESADRALLNYLEFRRGGNVPNGTKGMNIF